MKEVMAKLKKLRSFRRYQVSKTYAAYAYIYMAASLPGGLHAAYWVVV